MLNCREMTRLVTQSMDERLPWSKRLAVGFHLLICSSCRGFERQMQALRRWIGALRGDDAGGELISAKLPDAAREKMKEALNRERPS